MTYPTRKTVWILWGVACAFLTALLLFPPSYRITRAAIVFFGVLVWAGFIGLHWHRKDHRFFLWMHIGPLVLLCLPAQPKIDTAALRASYLENLRAYRGVRYYWGGESSRGLDCSGLVRRGLVDALFGRGIRTLDGGLVRRSLSLWWHDSSAEALGTGETGWTQPVLETPTLQALDHSRILPGDLAVTKSGLHIMAYVGEERWIEADPALGNVIELPVSNPDFGWLQTPMHIVRWRMLAE